VIGNDILVSLESGKGKVMNMQAADHLHLVGSIGLGSVEEVFHTVGPMFGSRLRRIPDGEPGPRRLWASFQYPVLRASPYLRPDPSGAVRATSGFPLLCLAEGTADHEVEFGELGYLREAKGSYLDFCAARTRGELSGDTRFQVCLPTPMGVIYAFCTSRNLTAIDQAYEKAMIHEVEAICRAIPHKDLCIQWDFCHEMIMLDGQSQDWFPLINASMPEIMARIARICAPIPNDVELGIHLCYGDFGAKHFIEPRDARRMVEVANAMTQSIARPITYIHVPVPRSRTDEDFFAPLRDLKLAPETELYLGLVHAADGAEGARKHMEVARKYAGDFGVATECGISRARKPDLVRQILKIHTEVCGGSAA
jgi:hypothetical protein